MSRTVKSFEISVTGGGKKERLHINYRITQGGPWKSMILDREMMLRFMEALNNEWERTDRWAEAYL